MVLGMFFLIFWTRFCSFFLMRLSRARFLKAAGGGGIGRRRAERRAPQRFRVGGFFGRLRGSEAERSFAQECLACLL